VPEPPRCPITGEPAARLIQNIDARFLRALWRISMRVDPTPLFAGVARFGLWESPCGLAFFDPPIAGDASFYRDFYRRIGAHEKLSGEAVDRVEFRMAAERSPPGARVLDVGCGEGGFARYLPHATHVGLDPYFAADAPPGRDVRAETVATHAANHAGTYDAVVAFQVIEHVPDPVSLLRDMAACAAPGGLVMLGVPSWPSALTAIPNFVLNAPPHHLTWWTPPALRAIAARAGLSVEAVLDVPIGGTADLIAWMASFQPRRAGDRFFRHRWTWHASLAWGYAAGRTMFALRRKAPAVPPYDLLLIARKPA
jgi:SAM-dependent methyltransferase